MAYIVKQIDPEEESTNELMEYYLASAQHHQTTIEP
jgi:hypothetical protein